VRIVAAAVSWRSDAGEPPNRGDVNKVPRPIIRGGHLFSAAEPDEFPLLAHRVVSLRCNNLAAIDGTADLAAHPTTCL
jgi:hypothetical protein